MKAIEVSRWCGPGDLGLAEVPVPACGPGEVRIRMRAAPVSLALSLLIAGKYQRRPELPFVPGNTVAGVIEEVDAAAGRGLAPGQRVLAALEHGGLAGVAVAHAANVYPMPAGLGFAEATALNTSYNSVLAALTWPRLLDLRQGQTLLVSGAAGGVGTAAIEIGKRLGARVLATASSEAKRQWALSRGADMSLPSDPAQLRDAVRASTGGEGVDAALDPVGGATFEQALRCLKPGGRICPIGFASGVIPQVAANLILVKNITVCGLYMGYYKIDERERFEPEVQALFRRLGEWCEDGTIRPHVAASFPLERVSDAFAAVLDRQTIGHVVVTCG